MSSRTGTAEPPTSPWPHRLAVALCCATFPLVWVGGLVTTHDAGMAVPDWPDTYGYNLFLYPWTEWFAGPWELFIEHAHRLLAAAVGLLCIVFVVTVWRFDSRRWMRVAALAALLLVIGQGILGGMRVLFDARTLAMIHGCVGPLFFAYCVLLATLTSRRWQESSADRDVASASRVAAAALLLTALAYAQLVLGAQLRHIGASVAPVTFRGVVFFHLVGAAALLLVSLYLAARLHRDRSQDRWLRIPGIALAALVLLQVGLGAGAWVVNYGWPAWLGEHAYTAQFVVRAKDSWQANITTAHVAVGSLILATAAMIALRSLRLARGRHWAPRLSFVRTEAAA